MIKNIIIFGSNFGSIVHIEAIKKIKNLINISICSPNINKKKIKMNNIKKFDDYKEALQYNYNAVGVVTTPNIQSKICNYIIKNKNKIKYILLEKPIAHNFNETQKIIKGLIRKKINFIVNFIFENIFAFKKLKQFLKKKKLYMQDMNGNLNRCILKMKLKLGKLIIVRVAD